MRRLAVVLALCTPRSILHARARYPYQSISMANLQEGVVTLRLGLDCVLNGNAGVGEDLTVLVKTSCKAGADKHAGHFHIMM